MSERLTLSTDVYRAVDELAGDAILLAGDDGTYIDDNPAAARLPGVPRDEIRGRTIREFADGEGPDFEEAWNAFRTAGS